MTTEQLFADLKEDQRIALYKWIHGSSKERAVAAPLPTGRYGERFRARQSGVLVGHPFGAFIFRQGNWERRGSRLLSLAIDAAFLGLYGGIVLTTWLLRRLPRGRG